MDSELQPALTECALMIDVSITEVSSKDLSHLTTILEDNSLHMVLDNSNKQFSLLSPEEFCLLLI